MAKLPEQFNADNHEPAQEFSTYPAGDYIAEIVDADLVDTNLGDGQYVNVEYEFIDCEQNGDYVGRHYWDTFNLVNNNPTAVEIAQRQFSSLCRAIGKMIVDDTEELLNTPTLGLKIGVKKAKKKDIENGYPDDKNKTLAWKKLQVGTSEPTASAPVKKATSTATPEKTPMSTPSHPWKK